MTSLLAFDKNHNFQFKGLCKISITFLSSTLLIEPKNEEFKPNYASFKCNCVMKKNFLFVFADCDFMDFCLVFKNEKICQKVFDCLRNQEETIQDREDMIMNRFMVPIFQNIYANTFNSDDLIKLIASWINVLDEATKERYTKLMDDCHVLEPISAVMETQRVAKPPVKLQILPNRKRRIDELLKRDQRITLPKLSSYTKCFYFPQIQLGLIGRKGGARSKLLVFTSSELTAFHLFNYSSHRKVYACQACKWKKTAIIDVDENGNICAKQTATEHSCSPQSNIPENFTSSKIIKKPDYEILDYGKKYSKTIKSGKILIIFDTNDRRFCYEYCQIYKKFYCRGCTAVRKAKKAMAKLCNPDTEKEYVEIIKDDHICNRRQYEPEKHNSVHEYVLKPNFEIQHLINDSKRLIIFDDNDRSLCYTYYYSEIQNLFVCFPCTKEGKNVTANLCRNSEGDVYVLLSKAQHICKMKPYVPSETEVTTLHPPQIELLKETKNGLPKLFVFAENDRKQCYIFTAFRHTLSTQKYFCTGCRVKIDCRKSERSEFKEMVSGYLVTDENGSYCFKLSTRCKHICSPKDYQPEEFQCSPKCYDFFFFRQKNPRAIPQLALYHPDDKTLVFHFRFNKYKMYFICRECEKKKNHYSMSIQMDESGKAFFNHTVKKHTCKPQKVSSLLGPKFIKLKDAEINYQMYLKSQKQKIKEEENVVRYPNFELQHNKSGEPDKKLILFCQSNKELCYEYFYCSTSRNFICARCVRKNSHVTAKLCLGDGDEKYIILGKTEHACELMEYQPPCQILKSPNFIILNTDDDTKPTKIIIFTSSAKEFCYEYSYYKSSKSYGCTTCNTMGKKVTAKIIEDENGEQSLELSKLQHACQPRIYEPKKFIKNVIPESMFKLCKNTKDEENKKLLLFTSETKDMAFTYYANKEKIYGCGKCIRLGRTVSAKVMEKENGEKYLEHNKNQHLCHPEKVNIDELDTVIVKESMFEFHHSTKTGEKDRRIVVFTSEEKEFVYIYHWCQKNSYRCFKCQKHDKYVVAKVIENENGETHLELNGANHVCTPEEFKRENFIQRNLKKIEESMFMLTEDSKGQKDKRLIVFSSEEDKEIGYIFTWAQGNSFRCTKCFQMKTNNYAKLHFDENGKPSIFHDLDAHICEPRIWENRIVPESMFKFKTTSSTNNDLILFASESKKKGYEYMFCGRNYYKCRACFKQKKTVSANLEENENGQKYLKLNHAQHVCKPKAA